MNIPRTHKAVAAFALSLSIAAAHAAYPVRPSDDYVTRKVSYADLDLTREPGIKTLYARIRAAALQVCSPLDGRQIFAQIDKSRCITSAVKQAVRTVNNPGLTSHYLALYPQSDVGTPLTVKR